MMKKFELYLNFLEVFCLRLVQILLILMIIFIFSQVLFRYAFNNPLTWTEELSRHLMIWAAFIAAAVAYRRNAHLGIDIFIKKIPINLRKIILTFIYLIVLFYSLFLIYYGFDIVLNTMKQTSSALRYKMGYVYLSVPVSFILFSIFSLEKIYKLWWSDD